MSSITTVEQLLQANAEFAATFQGSSSLEQVLEATKQHGAPVVIISCFDPRSVPENIFGPNLMAASFRNAGGRVTEDVVRSVNILRTLMDIKKLIVLHHTDCGLTWTTDEEVKDAVKARTPGADLDSVHFGCWPKERLEETLQDDVLKLRKEPSFGGIEIRGFVLDVATGVVTEAKV